MPLGDKFRVLRILAKKIRFWRLWSETEAIGITVAMEGLPLGKAPRVHESLQKSGFWRLWNESAVIGIKAALEGGCH